MLAQTVPCIARTRLSPADRRPARRSAPALRPRRGALSSYRASLALATLAAILGVDFPAFPRRYAKAEAYGTGLMDAGVGSFVAASGLAHGLSAAARAGAGGGSSGRGGKRGGGAAVGAWRREAVRAAVLLALGELPLVAAAAA